MRSELNNELFDKIIDDLTTLPLSLDDILDKNDTTTYMFYKVIQADPIKSQRYMQARSIYAENQLSQRRKIMEKAMQDARCLPKSSNAIIAAAKELCRQIEYDCEKLIPTKYGNKLNLDDNSLKILMVNQNVSNNPISSSTNNNDKITVE